MCCGMEILLLHLIVTGVSVWYPVAGALDDITLEKPLLSGPSAALKGSVEVFICHMPQIPPNLSVLLTLYMERNLNAVIGEHSVNFKEASLEIPLVVSETHDGRLVCKASGNNNNTEIESTFSDGLELRVISPVEGAAVVSYPSTDDLWEGQTFTLQCNITRGTHVSYDWLKNGTPVHTGNDTSVLTIRSLSVQHTGDYMCVASNRLNDTMLFISSSNITSVRVKEYVSKPEISLDVIKIGDDDFKAIIKCWCDKGTPLNTFSLLNDTRVIGTETTDGLQAFFNVSIQLNGDMGWVRCTARNHVDELSSEPISLTVESVGGAVTVTPFKHVGRDFEVFGLVLRCKVERGTFPHYHWFLNNSRLVGRAAFYAVAWSDNSILSVSVGPHSSGFYSCQASDRFDNSNRISSPKILINKKVLNEVSLSVLLVVFSSFLLLIITLSVCCIYGAVLRRRYSRKYLLTERRAKTGFTSKHEEEDNEDDDYQMVMCYDEDIIHAEEMNDSHSEEDERSLDETVS